MTGVDVKEPVAIVPDGRPRRHLRAEEGKVKGNGFRMLEDWFKGPNCTRFKASVSNLDSHKMNLLSGRKFALEPIIARLTALETGGLTNDNLIFIIFKFGLKSDPFWS